MARLYPPNISGTLPSFYGNELIIPYSMNKIVKSSEVAGFALRVKSAATETFLFEVIGPKDIPVTFSEHEITFTLGGTQLSKMLVGEYYKVQIAYVETGSETIGYYSTVGIVKYTGRPIATIANFVDDAPNTAQQIIVGEYINETDPTERAYEYKFTLFAADKSTELQTTGWCSHIASNNIEDVMQNDDGDIISTLTQTDQFILKYTLDTMTTYYLRYYVRTNNDLYCHSPLYEVVETTTMTSSLKADLVGELDYDNACVILTLLPRTDLSEAIIVGTFEIGRAEELDNFRVWTTISRFNLNGHLPAEGRIFTDFTVEQGQHYKYAIRQLNSYNIYSSWMPMARWRLKNETAAIVASISTSNIYYENSGKTSPDRFRDVTYSEDDGWYHTSLITVSFEDAFLYDGKRQLRIRFDPKISSFKSVISDSKKTAIGSKYPYFFRNGIINYKEFPINGLISYLTDQDEYFASRTQELGMAIDWENTTAITDDNITYERRFKLAVLDWLNEDNIKLFKSPGEGNYLVRLNNVSLSPNDTLSRMIHTFSCTADEIADYSTDALIDQGFLSLELDTNVQTLFMTTILSQDLEEYAPWDDDFLRGEAGVYIKLEDFMPGTYVTIGGQKIMIGSTGQYELYLTSPVHFLYIDEENIRRNWSYGFTPTLTYGIESKGFTSFDIVSGLSARKFAYVRRARLEDSTTNANILAPYYDLKHEIERLYFVRFTAAPIIDLDISIDALQKYLNDANNNTAPLALDPNAVYKVIITDELLTAYPTWASQLSGKLKNYDFVYLAIDTVNNQYTLSMFTEYNPTVIYGKQLLGYNPNQEPIYRDNVLDLSVTGSLTITNVDYIPTDINGNPSIIIGQGIVAEFGLYQKIINYDMESNLDKVSIDNQQKFKSLKNNYIKAETNWYGTNDKQYKNGAGYLHFIGTLTDAQFKTRLTTYNNAKTKYLDILQEELAKREDEAMKT